MLYDFMPQWEGALKGVLQFAWARKMKEATRLPLLWTLGKMTY